MSHSFRIFFPLCAAAAAFSASAQEAKPPELTARELFYNATAEPTAAPKARPAKETPKVAKKKPAAAAAQQAVNAPQKSPAQPAATGTDTQYGGGRISPASDGTRTTAAAPASGTALGLKYTILKLSGNAMTETPPSSVFHAGDKIQFKIETNSAGYLYIVSQGSSGTWKPMFPASEIDGGSNRVEGFHTYTFPPEHRFVFDQQAGEEKLFIIFSRDLKPDFEQLVYSLQGDKAQPASQQEPKEQSQQVLRASIDDFTVGRLHETYSRDLVIERVGDDAHADSQEKAVYVVNATGSADSALVADLHLVHQ
jgi:hypothetical protein